MSASVTSILKQFNSGNSYIMLEEAEDVEMPVLRAKKRRLDHLSWEEKCQRKKLKNRVAAQTSRDRKKAKYDLMENSLAELMEQNRRVLVEFENQKKLIDQLRLENADLYKKLKRPCSQCSAQGRAVECDSSDDVRCGSAVSLLLPQGPNTHSAAAPLVQSVLLKIVLACLLYRTSWTSSTPKSIPARSNSSPSRCCRISPETWRRLLKQQILKSRSFVERATVEKWWGRHQNTWNPMDVNA